MAPSDDSATLAPVVRRAGARPRPEGRGWGREVPLAVLAVAAFVSSVLALSQTEKLLVLSVGGSLMSLALWFGALRYLRPMRRARLGALFAAVADEDPAPCFGSDRDGRVIYRNRAAAARFGFDLPQGGRAGGEAAAAAFGGLFADPGAVIERMGRRARDSGSAQEDTVTRHGHLRLRAHRVEGGGVLWRLDDLGAARPDAAAELPRLSLSAAGGVLAINPALRQLLGGRPRKADEISAELPLRPGEENEILTASGPVRCFVAEVGGKGRSDDRRELFVLPVAPTQSASHDAAAFEALPVPLMRLTPRAAVIAVNAAARLVMGDVAPGTRLSDLLEGLGRPVNDWVADACAGRTESRPEVMRLRTREDEVFLQVTLRRMVEQGRMELIAVLNDATQLKQLEAQFIQSQKMEAVGQLAGGVAHDFNNLLTAISGHCDLLMLRHDRSAPDYGDLEQIRQNANRAAALVRQLLAYSRKQTMNPEVLDLRDTLSDLTHLLNRLVGERISLSLVHDPDLHRIRADKRQIEQVIMNLVVNARDAMPSGGEIRIETRNFSLAGDMHRDRATVPAGEYVEVSVSDAGTGIAPEVLPKIFEPFFTTKHLGEGTGLGLSTVYGIVKQTGGYIFCDSVPGQGTRFWFLLPTYLALETLAPGLSPPEAVPLPSESPASVLLVEDEAAVRAFAARALKLRGYDVVEAEDGEEALEILSDPTLHFDIFVTDVVMPGLDGPSWVAEAMKTRPDTAVVFMSGYAEDAFRDGWPAIRASAFLPKPFSLGDLVETVQRTAGRVPA